MFKQKLTVWQNKALDNLKNGKGNKDASAPSTRASSVVSSSPAPAAKGKATRGKKK